MRHLISCKNKETASWVISTYTKMGMTVEVTPSVGNYDLIVTSPKDPAKVRQPVKLTSTQGWVASVVIALAILALFRFTYGIEAPDGRGCASGLQDRNLSLERQLEIEDSVQEQLLYRGKALVALTSLKEGEAVRKHLGKGGFIVKLTTEEPPKCWFSFASWMTQ